MSNPAPRVTTTTRSIDDLCGVVSENGRRIGVVYEDGGSFGYESDDDSVSEWFSSRSDAVAFALTAP